MEAIINTALQFGVDNTVGKVVWGVTALVVIANIITMLTPSTADNAVMDKVLKALNALSLNVLKNKNADDK